MDNNPRHTEFNFTMTPTRVKHTTRKHHIVLSAFISTVIFALLPYIHAQSSAPVIYKNKQYSFTFTLPASWKGYSIVTGTWQGSAASGWTGTPPPNFFDHGPVIIIRNPQWTKDDPREDIPIWIFTPDQWNRIENEHLIVSAAPFPPMELDHNKKFVFALPARYSYDNLTGVEEVLKINANHPLHAF
jgi:hypothetical protein